MRNILYAMMNGYICNADIESADENEKLKREKSRSAFRPNPYNRRQADKFKHYI